MIIFSLSVSRFPDDDEEGKATTQPLLKKGRRITLLCCLITFLLLFVFCILLRFVSLRSYFPFLAFYDLILHIVSRVNMASCALCLCLASLSVPCFRAANYLALGNNILSFPLSVMLFY